MEKELKFYEQENLVESAEAIEKEKYIGHGTKIFSLCSVLKNGILSEKVAERINLNLPQGWGSYNNSFNEISVYAVESDGADIEYIAKDKRLLKFLREHFKPHVDSEGDIRPDLTDIAFLVNPKLKVRPSEDTPYSMPDESLVNYRIRPQNIKAIAIHRRMANLELSRLLDYTRRNRKILLDLLYFLRQIDLPNTERNKIDDLINKIADEKFQGITAEPEYTEDGYLKRGTYHLGSDDDPHSYSYRSTKIVGNGYYYLTDDEFQSITSYIAFFLKSLDIKVGTSGLKIIDYIQALVKKYNPNLRIIEY